MKISMKELLVGLLAISAFATAFAESELTLLADVPTALVTHRAAERSPLELPDLEYNFRIQAQCHGDLEAASLLLAVADTRRAFDQSQIASGELNAVTMRIPSSQIAPLVIADFCVAPDDETGNESSQLPLIIRSALSAQASLLCVNESFKSMKYASAPLDVQLQCKQNAEPRTSPRQ
jgi:hypothetical protein